MFFPFFRCHLYFMCLHYKMPANAFTEKHCIIQVRLTRVHLSAPQESCYLCSVLCLLSCATCFSVSFLVLDCEALRELFVLLYK